MSDAETAEVIRTQAIASLSIALTMFLICLLVVIVNRKALDDMRHDGVSPRAAAFAVAAFIGSLSLFVLSLGASSWIVAICHPEAAAIQSLLGR